MDNINEIFVQSVLYSNKEKFILDFDLMDVKADIGDKIFTKQEYSQILKHKNGKDQIEKLFYILGYDRNKLNDFIIAIGEKYDWLSNDLRADLRNNTRNITHVNVVNEKLNVLRSEMPRLADFNVHRHEYVCVI